MYKLIKLMAVALVFAFVIQKKDESLSDGHEFKQKEFFLTFFLAMVLGVFTGLRIWYNDTVTYLQMYEQAPVISEFWNSQDASFAGGYGFGLVNSLLKTWGASSQDFIMVYGVATMLLYITFLHRYSENFTLSVFLFLLQATLCLHRQQLNKALQWEFAVGQYIVRFKESGQSI